MLAREKSCKIRRFVGKKKPPLLTAYQCLRPDLNIFNQWHCVSFPLLLYHTTTNSVTYNTANVLSCIFGGQKPRVLLDKNQGVDRAAYLLKSLGENVFPCLSKLPKLPTFLDSWPLSPFSKPETLVQVFLTLPCLLFSALRKYSLLLKIHVI